MQRNKPIKILLIVGIITLGLTIVAATNAGYSSKLFKPQIMKQKPIDENNLYELLTSDGAWSGTADGNVVTPSGDTFTPFAAWKGTIRTYNNIQTITGDWIDLTYGAYGKFNGTLDDNDSVFGSWWTISPVDSNGNSISGPWKGKFDEPVQDSMRGKWHYYTPTDTAHGDIYGKRD